MGETRESGVTDPLGRVYRNDTRSPTDTYQNLYVMDGALIPGSVGVNPFMTIASLSFYLARLAVGATVDESTFHQLSGTTISEEFRELPVGNTRGIPTKKSEVIEGVFSEKMFFRIPQTHDGYANTLDRTSLNKFLIKRGQKALDVNPKTLALEIKFFSEKRTIQILINGPATLQIRHFRQKQNCISWNRCTIPSMKLLPPAISSKKRKTITSCFCLRER